MSNWSSRIRAERERQNLTREQVVQRMLQFLPDSEKAVTTRTLMAWEAGEREPRVTVGLALALALGVEDMTDLYLDSDCCRSIYSPPLPVPVSGWTMTPKK